MKITRLKLTTMPQESQNIEFKESWRDEYLKWIYGFPMIPYK